MQYYPYPDYYSNNALGQDVQLDKKLQAYWAGKFVIAGKPITKAMAQQLALQQMSKVEKFLKNILDKGQTNFTTNASQSLRHEVTNLNSMMDIYERIYKDSYLTDSQYFNRIQSMLSTITQWEPQAQISLPVDNLIKIGKPQSVPTVTVDVETGEALPSSESVTPRLSILTSEKELSDLRKTLETGEPMTDKQQELHQKLQRVYTTPESQGGIDLKKEKKTNFLPWILAAAAAFFALKG